MKVFLTGGGTAGHVNPALALGKILLENDHDVLYIGSDAPDSLDRELVLATKLDIQFIGLNLLTPKSRNIFKRLVYVMRIIFAFFKCLGIVRKEKPDIIIGTGGFVSQAMVMAGVFKGVKTAICEQNVFPGLSNRFLAKFVNHIYITFPSSAEYFPEKLRGKIVVSGLPLINKPKFLSHSLYKKRIKDGFKVLVTGGSNGSVYLNELTIEMAALAPEFEFTLGCGRIHYPFLTEKDMSENLELLSYIKDMPERLEGADLVVARAGSSTVFEILAAGLPAILIPSPNVTNDHQRLNAKFLVEKKAGIMLDEDKTNATSLLKIIRGLVAEPEKLYEMRMHAKEDGQDAGRIILEDLIKGF